MAENKLKTEKNFSKPRTEKFIKHNTEVLPDFFFEAEPEEKHNGLQKRIEEILEQRSDQRKEVLWFAKVLTCASLGVLIFLCVLQAVVRLYNPAYKIFDGSEFQILLVGVFGQIIGVIYIISRSLWNDKNYLDTLDKYL